MSKTCVLGSIIFFILFAVFVSLAFYVFSLSLSMVLKYKAISYVDITSFLIDSAISVLYLLLAVILLLVAGIMLYGATVSLLKCED